MGDIKRSEIRRSTVSENGILKKDLIQGHIYDLDYSTGKGYKIRFANDGRPGSVLREKKVNFYQPAKRVAQKKYRKTPMPARPIHTRRYRRVQSRGTRKNR